MGRDRSPKQKLKRLCMGRDKSPTHNITILDNSPNLRIDNHTDSTPEVGVSVAAQEQGTTWQQSCSESYAIAGGASQACATSNDASAALAEDAGLLDMGKWPGNTYTHT
jgi:hypothetical protein